MRKTLFPALCLAVLWTGSEQAAWGQAIAFTKITDLGAVGLPGWAAQTPLDVDFSTTTRSNASVLVVTTSIFESWCDIRFIKLTPSAAPIRTVIDFTITNIGYPWRGFLINLIQPALPLPAKLAAQFTQADAFTHTIYAHFHPSQEVTQSSGPISNDAAWGPSFTKSGATSFTPLDQTADFGYDASYPMGPPTGFHVTWDVQSREKITITGLKIHLTNPGPQSLDASVTIPEDANVVLRITPDFSANNYP